MNLYLLGDKLKKSISYKRIIFAVTITLFLLLGVTVVVSCKDSVEKQSKNLTNYNINLSFDDGTKLLTGSQTVDYVNPYEVCLNKLEFHLYPNAFRGDAKVRPVNSNNFTKAYDNGFSEGKIDVSSVKVNDEDRSVNVSGEDNNMLVVDLNFDLYPDDRVKVQIDYIVTLPNCNHRFGYGVNTYNFGNFYPVVSIYQNGSFRQDLYGANGDPFYSDMANYYVNITYDSDFTLASSGVQNSTNQNTTKNTTQITALGVRDFAFVLSKNFSVKSATAGNTTVYYYYYDDPSPDQSLKAGVDAINTFNKLFGEYPYSTYSVVKTNFVHGGMEYPNLVYISDSVEDYKDYINVIIHETAHQWWYNLVGSDACNNAWQDEGLTEFSTLMFYRENPDYNVDMQQNINASLSSYILFSEVYESVYGKFDSVMSKNVNDFSGEMLYVYNTYVKGELFFDALEDLLGEKLFLKGLKNYFNNYKFKIASTDDMISSFEMVSNRDLKGFFDSWLNGKVILQSYN